MTRPPLITVCRRIRQLIPRPPASGRWLLVTLVCALLLAGCVDMGVESEYYADGSVQQTIVVTIDRSGLAQIAQAGMDTSFITDPETARRLAEERGLEYEQIDTAEQVGARFSKVYPDSHDTGATITDLFNSTLPDEQQIVPDGTFSGTFDNDGNLWGFTLTIDVERVLSAFGAVPESAQITPDMLDQVFDLTYAATFPGNVSETDGARLSDTQVEWDLPTSGTTTMTASGRIGTEDDESSWWLVLVFGGGIIVLGLALGYWWLTRRRTMPPAEPSVSE